MSNDTQVLRATLETALARIEDMLADDDGQAFKEARKFLESARPLTASPTAPTEASEPVRDKSKKPKWRAGLGDILDATKARALKGTK